MKTLIDRAGRAFGEPPQQGFESPTFASKVVRLLLKPMKRDGRLFPELHLLLHSDPPQAS
ncbi:MAG: hypothetical protein M3367_13220 [Acidobacteriota bacterium]|nr:hypothetical protein [Acidobacteriota bacterium]